MKVTEDEYSGETSKSTRHARDQERELGRDQ